MHRSRPTRERGTRPPKPEAVRTSALARDPKNKIPATVEVPVRAGRQQNEPSHSRRALSQRKKYCSQSIQPSSKALQSFVRNTAEESAIFQQSHLSQPALKRTISQLEWLL